MQYFVRNYKHPPWLIQLIPHNSFTTPIIIRSITDETISIYMSARNSVNGFTLNFFCYKLCTGNKVHYYVIWKRFLQKKRWHGIVGEYTEWRKSCLSDNRWCDNQWGNPVGAFASTNTTDIAAVDTSKVGSNDVSSSSASVLLATLLLNSFATAWASHGLKDHHLEEGKRQADNLRWRTICW